LTIKRFSVEEYALPFFKKEGFVRKLCPKCGEYYWTQNQQQETCGESSSDECGYYTFLRNPPTKQAYSLPEMREAFLSFFEKHGHTRINPYPVVARWRRDIYLTHASIIDFQPYVTDGISPPPANPLVIAQPCIRLVDISNTGPTFGRHMTIFEMGGHHAFNYPDKEIYWKDQTVQYHHEFVTEVLGVKSEEVTYKEDVWVGGGNAGPDVECIIGGLEVGTLVFMQYKVMGDEFVKLQIRTVDTGYGLDRFAWLSQGVASCFHAIYGTLLNTVFELAGLTNVDDDFLCKVAKYSGLVSVDKTVNRLDARRRVAKLVGVDMAEMDKILAPIENAFAVADHTKCLSFLLSEGVVPSNIHEGYLARLLFRRVYRLMLSLNMKPDQLYDIVDMQVDYWSKDYPRIRTMRNEIIEMLKVEEEKFEDTLKRGEEMVKRIASELKGKNIEKLPEPTLSELYDSHGIPPEIVKQVAENQGLIVEVPENFYNLVAKRHMQATKTTEEQETKPEKMLDDAVEGLPATEQLYYSDQYMKEFDAKVLKTTKDGFIVLDKTCFYPEGGGQPADHGFLLFSGLTAEVVEVQKVGKVIVHKITGSLPAKGTVVRGMLDWERRYALMKAHTATHLVNGAARRVLGEHVWQHGTQKGLEISRLDISHYRRLTPEEVHKIETLANQAVTANMHVETAWLTRNEAESRYGFRLYQGGAVPGKDIRVVKTGNWDVEACAGTHLKNTGEVGFLKTVYTERVQDGVERLGYAVGPEALKAVQRQELILWKVSETLNAPTEKLDKTAEKLVKELKEANIEKRKLIKELAAKESTSLETPSALAMTEKIDGYILVKRDFQENIDVNRMVQTATEMVKKDEETVALFYGSDGKTARILVMAGKKAVEKGVDAGTIVRKASSKIGGGGGGRCDFAQGGGTKPEMLQEAVKSSEELIRKQLGR
jgi:alanyl-tRNA synthetase